MIERILPRRRPLIVGGVGRDTALSFCGHTPAHRHAEGIGAGGQDRIDVGLDRIHVRRNEDAPGIPALLVHVVDDLWIPLRVERVHGVTRLHLREGVPVAVIVVAGVLVVQLRRLGSLGLGVERAPVPVADDVHAVRILRRHENHNRVGEHRFGVGGFAAGETVGEYERRRESTDFGGMDGRRNENHVLAVNEQLLQLLRLPEARIHQLALDLLVAVEIRERGRIRDKDREEGAAEGRLAERPRGDARARLVERGEVVGHLLPGRKLAVSTRLIAEDRGRGRQRGGRALLRGERVRRGEDSRGEHASEHNSTNRRHKSSGQKSIREARQCAAQRQARTGRYRSASATADSPTPPAPSRSAMVRATRSAR